MPHATQHLGDMDFSVTFEFAQPRDPWILHAQLLTGVGIAELEMSPWERLQNVQAAERLAAAVRCWRFSRASCGHMQPRCSARSTL